MLGIKAVCPNNEKHIRFLTTAHVAQTWKVDPRGNFIEEVSTDETTHPPHIDNIWICDICHATAAFVEAPEHADDSE